VRPASKRRIAAVTIGHLPRDGSSRLSADAGELERLVDEYAQAMSRPPRRRLARLIVDAARTGLAASGIAAQPDQTKRCAGSTRGCDLKDLGDQGRGQHIYGRAP